MDLSTTYVELDLIHLQTRTLIVRTSELNHKVPAFDVTLWTSIAQYRNKTYMYIRLYNISESVLVLKSIIHFIYTDILNMRQIPQQKINSVTCEIYKRG